MLAQGQVERGPERGGGRIGGARDPVGELPDDRTRKRIGDHLHVARPGAERGEGTIRVLRGLGVDHRLEGEHVVLHQIGDHRLGQVRVRPGEEGPEVLRVTDQVVDRAVLPGARPNR